jgi:NADH dehydrogenase FAD-containing subunit
VVTAIGQLAAIGRRTGVANIMGVNFSGFLAWWLWRTIYLSKLPRFEKKVRVALDWTLSPFLQRSRAVRHPPSPDDVASGKRQPTTAP